MKTHAKEIDKTLVVSDISAVTCNPDSGGTAECAAKDSNAECKTGEDKCSCAEKYIFKTDKSACTASNANFNEI
jgi:hypothetical protein